MATYFFQSPAEEIYIVKPAPVFQSSAKRRLYPQSHGKIEIVFMFILQSLLNGGFLHKYKFKLAKVSFTLCIFCKFSYSQCLMNAQ